MSADDKAKWRGMTTDEKVRWMQINALSPKRNGGMTADEKAKWRGMSADEKAMRMQINALSLQTVTPNVFKAGLNSAGAEAASTPKQMPEPQVETVEKTAEVEKIAEEPARTPLGLDAVEAERAKQAEADAAQGERVNIDPERIVT